MNHQPQSLTTDLNRSSLSSPSTGKESLRGTRVNAKIKMDISTITVRHVADCVPIDGTKVINGNLDTLLRHRIAIEILRDSDLIASPACRTSALAWTNAELELRESGGIAIVEGRIAAGIGCGETVWRTVCVAGAILSEGSD